MRKLVTTAVLLAGLSVSALAQMAPTGPADCKANETWDQATRTCKPN
jgi:hypothetical protein